MSGSGNARTPIANISWLLSESAQRAIQIGAIPRITDDSVRRNLDNQYSDASDPELQEHIVSEREFPFTSFDESLFEIRPIRLREGRRPRPFVSRTPSRVSLRREFSLTSYESDIFNPEEIYQLTENMSVVHTSNERNRTSNPPEIPRRHTINRPHDQRSKE